jgi:1-acyl-sn-glycerol-3-phosphate acyltransferase
MKLYKLSPLILQAIFWPFTIPFLKFFVGFEVIGKENLKGLKGPVIFASNHISEIDPILVRAALPMFSSFTPLFYVARKNYLDSIEGPRKYIYGGLFFKAWGAYPTESGKGDYSISLKNHIKLLNEGCSLCIFPEGKISENGQLGEVHGGLGYLYKEMVTNVIIVKISGAFKINLKSFFTRKNRISIKLTPLAHIKALTDKDYKKISLELMRPELETV